MQREAAKRSSRKRLVGERWAHRLLVELANMRDDGVGVFLRNCRGFTRCEPEELRLRDELRLLWPGRRVDYGDDDSGPMVARTLNVSSRSAWIVDVQEEQQLSLEEIILQGWLSGRGCPLTVDRTRKYGLIRLRLWSLPTGLAMAYDQYAGKLRYCANPDCPAPYFIAKRKDQLYCENVCAAPAKRAAQVRYWHRVKGANAAKDSLPHCIEVEAPSS